MTEQKERAAVAGKRSRERLAEKLRDITGDYAVAEVRITPALYGGGTVWCAMAIGRNRREIPLPGLARQVVAVVREAFPGADWDRAQDYDVTTGALTEHRTAAPAGLGGEEL